MSTPAEVDSIYNSTMVNSDQHISQLIIKTKDQTRHTTKQKRRGICTSLRISDVRKQEAESHTFSWSMSEHRALLHSVLNRTRHARRPS